MKNGKIFDLILAGQSCVHALLHVIPDSNSQTRQNAAINTFHFSISLGMSAMPLCASRILHVAWNYVRSPCTVLSRYSLYKTHRR